MALRYEVPQPGFHTTLEYKDPIRLLASGQFEFRGTEITVRDIEHMFAEAQANGFSMISISVDGEASFGDVVAALDGLQQGVAFDLADTHRTIAAPEKVLTGSHVMPHFMGDVEEFQLPVVVDYHRESNQCLIALDGELLGPKELADRPFERLDNLVWREQGFDRLLEATNQGEALLARVQAPPQTPWHCIAATTFNIRKAGWMFIEYEVTSQ